jgi:NTE family protein
MTTNSRALVLGGGGPVGIAWESGLVAGLAKGGVDLTEADTVIGTSAGSVVGSRLALGMDAGNALEAIGPVGAALAAKASAVEPSALFAAVAESLAAETTEAGLRLLGRRALAADTVDEDVFVRQLSFLDDHDWPAGYACTAIDVETGELQVWDATTGVPLSRAVASSCAAPLYFPPVTINGRRYMDGGVRTALNADLATGHSHVVAVSCFMITLPPGMVDATVAAMNNAVKAELALVRERGEALAVIEPGVEFLTVSGAGLYLMDFARVADAYAVGLRQAEAELEQVRAVWNG